jgi:hypothetical protein
MQELFRLFKSHTWLKGIAGTIGAGLVFWGLSMILPPTYHNGISLIILGIAVVGILWALSLRHKVGNKRVFYLVIACIVVGCVFIATQLDFRSEQIQEPQARPKVRIDFSSTSTKVYDNFIKFCVKNVGNSTAYQYRATIFVAPDDQIQNVTSANVTTSTNTLEPNEPVYTSIDIIGATQGNGIWYICFKLTYNDSRGHIYSSDPPYWLFCNFSEPQKGFGELSPTQRDEFEANITARYPNWEKP